MQENYDFIRGHCGWDSVTLLYGEQIPKGREHEIALSLLFPPSFGGAEVGFLYKPKNCEDIRLRIIDSTTRTWLPMCGGMSQVIGKAAIETKLKDYFNIKIQEPFTTVNVQTDSGLVPIEIEVSDGVVKKVTTNMSYYAGYLYKEGVKRVNILGVDAVKVGYFLIINIDDLKKKYPKYDFRFRGLGSQWEALRDIQAKYLIQEGIDEPALYCMLYDMHPEGEGDARIFTRFYREDAKPRFDPYELNIEGQCGTGTIAVGLAMVEKGDIKVKDGLANILFELGSKYISKDPYGLRTTLLKMNIQNKKIIKASFSHSVIELLATGKIYLPSRPLKSYGIKI